MNVIGRGQPGGALGTADAGEIITKAAQSISPDGKKVLVLIPDHTRTCPLPMIVRELRAAVAPRARSLDFLIALGTHQPLNEHRIDKLLGIEPGRRGKVLGDSRVFNHRWDDRSALTAVGTLSARQVEQITGGKFALDVTVTINKLVLDYDIVLVACPVFPHEVVGFSGGAKYFFPGICGEEMVNFFHWLAAVITNPRIIGVKDNPVRAALEAAADMLKVEKFGLCMVVAGHDLAGLYFGPLRAAWSEAADLSSRVHITYLDRTFSSVLSGAPEMYDDLWVGGKCMYKLEPVVADGGELIIYGPHIREISHTHGKIIRQIGYHVRDYYLSQWDKFKKYHWAVIAHTTRLRGIGTYENGVEKPRIKVTLATGIDEATCRKINLGYRDPVSIDTSYWQNHEDDGRLYVPRAGEALYRLKDPPAWQKPYTICN
jgi:nickel-dependent lactate racemase